MDNITLIIPVKNEGKRLARCLEGVEKQSLKPADLVVVDGHSTDDTVEIARRHGARVFFESVGTRAAACQVGIMEAQEDIIAFTDADCIPDSGWLENLVDSLEDDIVGVGGRVVNQGDAYWERAVDAALDTLIGSANSVQGRRFDAKREVGSISG